jgi:hypothetical protein
MQRYEAGVHSRPDVGAIVQVFLNLPENAAEAM